MFALLGGAGSGYLRRPGGEQPPSPTQVVCSVNHRLITISSLVSSLVSSPVVAGHAHTRTLAHSDTAPSRQAHTHSHLVPLKVTGEQPAQPVGLYSGHSGRSRASRTLSAGLVLASLQSSPPLPPRQYHRHRHEHKSEYTNKLRCASPALRNRVPRICQWC